MVCVKRSSLVQNRLGRCHFHPRCPYAFDACSKGRPPLVEAAPGHRVWLAPLVAAMALATGTAVAQTGLIAFVGLAAPHLVRSIVRVTHERHIVLSSLMGAVLLLAADILARWVLAPQELPVGVLTAALGGTYLLWLMHRRTSQGSAL